MYEQVSVKMPTSKVYFEMLYDDGREDNTFLEVSDHATVITLTIK